jgi:hypothetical protein
LALLLDKGLRAVTAAAAAATDSLLVLLLLWGLAGQ